MKFNVDTFIVPINNDVILKLRDIHGNVVYYIKVPDCTVAVSENNVLVKQQSESNTMVLEFDNRRNAISAQKLLREALIILKNNQETVDTKRYHLHEQTIPSNNWTIYHGLGKYTHVTIYDDDDYAIIGTVQKLSPNGLRILFNKPITGKAIIS